MQPSTTLISTDAKEPWVRRLFLPAYQVNDAARYVGITTQTIRNWQREADETTGSAIAPRASREALSYLQLQELAIVAAMRELGVKLRTIRLARDWLSFRFALEFPFSDNRVKSDGQDILMECDDLGGDRKLLVANKGGQFVWTEIIGNRFNEFEYEKNLAIRWHVGGANTGIIIDPRIAFGAPSIRGVPTWALRGRFTAGETINDIAADFVIKAAEVRKALKFEHVSIN
ncbi:MAG TPA: DUF433 domain-containing protein [Casimicrobiaceae bacterium]|nr:DUF433 domain-containing protein [Casimicrobiaceae bacterium]